MAKHLVAYSDDESWGSEIWVEEYSTCEQAQKAVHDHNSKREDKNAQINHNISAKYLGEK